MSPRYEYLISYVIPACAYFRCNICNELIALDYPETYEESQETYACLVKKHRHRVGDGNGSN
jgi:hypothetical protein